jgi:hypothetical protein
LLAFDLVGHFVVAFGWAVAEHFVAFVLAAVVVVVAAVIINRRCSKFKN